MTTISAVEVREINKPDIRINEETGAVEYESHDGVNLSAMEVAFVEYYCGQARFSANKAFALAKGKSYDHNSIGALWLTKPHIQKAIRWRLDAVGASEREALASLKQIAMADWSEMVDIQMRNGEVHSVKMDLMPIVRANEIILRAHGALDNKNGVTVPIQININTNIPEDDLA